jgi:hypothetical protein
MRRTAAVPLALALACACTGATAGAPAADAGAAPRQVMFVGNNWARHGHRRRRPHPPADPDVQHPFRTRQRG